MVLSASRISRPSRMHMMGNWCQHCGHKDHITPDCAIYPLSVPRYTLPSRFSLPCPTYTYDAGCVDLSKATNFCGLLSSIREHLRTSVDTQGHYVSVARKKFYKLWGTDRGGPVPCHDDFLQFVVNHWPMFRSIRGSASTVIWGRVLKHDNSPNEIGINNCLIAQAEGASMNPSSHLPVAQYNLILAVIILHEISHTFTKYLFDNVITPEGVGPTRNGSGELEKQLIGGIVLASWNRKADISRMEMIDGVVLKTDGTSRIIDVDAAKSILRSFGHAQLVRLSALNLLESPGGDFRARVTEPSSIPERERVPHVGLGFTSYLGSDRWTTPL